MKNNKIVVGVVFALVFVFYYIVYYNRPDTEMIKAINSPIELKVRESVTFIEEYAPEESFIRLKCVCEDPMIARIESNKVEVTGLSVGTTTINCSSGGKELATLEVIVTK